MILPRVCEQRRLCSEARQAGGELRAEPIEVVAAELIDSDEDHERRPLRSGGLRGRKVRGAGDERRAGETGEFH
jgi:hypothetical protein